MYNCRGTKRSWPTTEEDFPRNLELDGIKGRIKSFMLWQTKRTPDFIVVPDQEFQLKMSELLGIMDKNFGIHTCLPQHNDLIWLSMPSSARFVGKYFSTSEPGATSSCAVMFCCKRRVLALQNKTRPEQSYLSVAGAVT
ncbi:unnamed protein product [Phytophthora lilii]|uniref:Unnamed protein product n=1 Tax=Phytophthora lilii TaxID=2077276 RepID=A0A9W6XGD9_9STRA|nr:unnamed protein product [Phytophthora lilii]